ncbi:CHAT domain-containing protein [Deltaproteobacteria bacterium TL4]
MNKKLISVFFLLLLSACSLLASPADEKKRLHELFNQGEKQFEQGQFEQAVDSWKRVVTLSEKMEPPEFQVQAMIRLATAYQFMGFYQQTLDVLGTALSLEGTNGRSKQYPLLLSRLGDVYLALGEVQHAEASLAKAIELARQNEQGSILARALNNLGNVFTVQKSFAKAIESYEEGLVLAQNEKDVSLQSKILLNISRTQLNQGDANSEKTLFQAKTLLFQLPESYNKAHQLLTLGTLAQRIQTGVSSTELSSELLNVSYEAFTQAVTIAKTLQNNRTLSLGKGLLGGLYETEKRFPEALQLTQQAIFFAQQENALELLYQWQWQMGRLLKAEKHLDAAIPVYRQAVSNLQLIKPELSKGGRHTFESFREKVAPVYYGLADLLLLYAETLITTDQKQQYLREARETIELLKTAELQDYFQDECVTEFQNKNVTLDTLAAHTAVFYPIPLPDRIVLLLSLPDGIKQFSTPVSAETLGQEVNLFRQSLQTRINRRFLRYGQELYQWIITPLEATLQEHQIHTLVVVPDGMLRTIPFSALHSGEQYLIEKYAVATSPGLSLTAPQRLKAETQVLLNGLSESVQGFPALTNVSQELDSIQKISGGTILHDQMFSIPNMDRELKNHTYSILHIASHGQFGSTPEDSFLLTYDSKLTMNRLSQLLSVSRFRENPVELLTLSACQTAIGDDRAALGLAGVAVKAGARSALATLWFVDDSSTSLLITEFYRQLQNPMMSKAQALQQAQKTLLEERLYRHPTYWAPFLLIGNWL